MFQLHNSVNDKSNRNQCEQLKRLVASIASPFLNIRSRVHPLNNSPPHENVSLFIKRDDELSFGVSGSKIRKYTSIIPHLKKLCAKRVCLIGGAYSNNILGLAQLLIENEMQPILFLRNPGNTKEQIRGNFLFIKMLVPEEDIVMVDRDSWDHVEKIVCQKECGHPTIVIPEGAMMPEALPGALTLPLDIVENETALGTNFHHIFIDAGTGMQAIALILGGAICFPNTMIHVLLLAQNKEEFQRKLNEYTIQFQRITGFHVKALENFSLYTPTKGASFGSVPKSGFKDIVNIARTEGVFVDPIYSGKLMTEAKSIIKQYSLCGNILIVHSGGGLSLAGFQHQLASVVSHDLP